MKLEGYVITTKSHKGENDRPIKAGSIGIVSGGGYKSSYVEFENDSAYIPVTDLKPYRGKAKYKVLLKGSFNIEKGEHCPHYELSVINENNYFGRDSYGWGGKDKIILFENNYNSLSYSDKTGVSQKDRRFALKVANSVCKAANNS